MSARLLSDKDLQLIRKFDKKSEAIQAQLLEEVNFVHWEAGSAQCMLLPDPLILGKLFARSVYSS